MASTKAKGGVVVRGFRKVFCASDGGITRWYGLANFLMPGEPSVPGTIMLERAKETAEESGGAIATVDEGFYIKWPEDVLCGLPHRFVTARSRDPHQKNTVFAIETREGDKYRSWRPAMSLGRQYHDRDDTSGTLVLCVLPGPPAGATSAP